MSKLNTRAGADARHARTGKDGALYNSDGVLLATIESFQSQAAFNNAKYQVLGDGQEHEAMNTYGITLTASQVVVEDDQFIEDIFTFMQTQVMPEWSFQGVVQGRNGSEERVVYREVIPSGTIDLQNISTGDVVKRAWSFFVNQAPALQSRLTVDR